MKNHCQGKNENVCLIVQIEKEEQISVLQALLFKSTRLLHHLTKKFTYLFAPITLGNVHK